ncbi:hypothetical protein N9P82_00040 [bacterium]|nr:hypothetical protein [bacterium]
MHATCERRNDAKPSSEDALVDVDVDRCIDEDLASNLKYSLSFTEASSTKTEAPSINFGRVQVL